MTDLPGASEKAATSRTGRGKPRRLKRGVRGAITLQVTALTACLVAIGPSAAAETPVQAVRSVAAWIPGRIHDKRAAHRPHHRGVSQRHHRPPRRPHHRPLPRSHHRGLYRPHHRPLPRSHHRSLYRPHHRPLRRPRLRTGYHLRLERSWRNKQIAWRMAARYGWSTYLQFPCLERLWTRESNWNHRSANRWGAYGIPQALPGIKMRSAGADWRTNPRTQIRWGLRYIRYRYGNPCRAWAHSLATGWY